jgi:hypothetical protein
MTMQEMNEMYNLIKEAVKDGFLEAMAEAETREKSQYQYPDSERPTSSSGVEIPKLNTPDGDAFAMFGETSNAKAFMKRLSGKLNSVSPLYTSTLRPLWREMCTLLSEDEKKFVLTHIDSSVPESDRKLMYKSNLDDFMEIALEG